MKPLQPFWTAIRIFVLGIVALTTAAYAQDQTINGNLTVSGNATVSQLLASGGTLTSPSTTSADVLTIYSGDGSNTGNAVRVYAANTGDILNATGSLGSGWFRVTTAYNTDPNLLISGRVGIGTASPHMALDVQSGSAQVANIQLNDAAINTAPNLLHLYHSSSVQPIISGAGVLGFGSQIEFSAPLNSGSGVLDQAAIGAAYTGSNGNSSALYFQTESTGALSTQMLIDPTGNVGIGTINPGYKLVVASPQSVANNTVIAEFTKDGSTNNFGSAVIRLSRGINNESTDLELNSGGSGPFRYGTYADTLFVNNQTYTNGPYGSIHFITNGAPRMTIGGGTLAGNLGIGTTSPNAKLEIAGTMSTGDEAGIRLTDLAGRVWRLQSGIAGTNHNYFGITDVSAGSSTRLTIDSNGYVGIGTTTPGSKLQISGGDIDIDNGYAIRSGGDGLVSNFGNNLIQFGSGNPLHEIRLTAGGVDRLHILTNGNVGIGTPSPGAKLDVAGNANIQGSLTVAGTFSAPGYTASGGTVTGGTSGLTLSAGGTNQNVAISPSGTGSVVINGNTTIANGTLVASTIASGPVDPTSSRHFTGYVNALVDGGSGTPQYYTIGTLDLSATQNTSGMIEGVISVGRSYQDNPEYRFSLAYYKATGSATANLSTEYSEALGALKLFRNGDVFQLVAYNDHANQVGLYYDLTHHQGTYVVGSAWIQLATNPTAAASSATPPAGFSEMIGNEFVFAHIKDNGRIGIGTIRPDKALTVNGTIHATEVVVDTAVSTDELKVRPKAWADDILASDHPLAPLSTVEQQIKSTGHLPGMPSASEVAADGVSVGDMQARLLAKLEELTLHQIEQEKFMKQQAALVAQQGAEIKQLQAENAALRAR